MVQNHQLQGQSALRDIFREVVKNALGRSALSGIKTTQQSLIYRRRASVLGEQANDEPDLEKMMPLLHQALHWVNLAENEEILAQSGESSREGSPRSEVGRDSLRVIADEAASQK